MVMAVNGKWARFLFGLHCLPVHGNHATILIPLTQELNAREDADYPMKQLAWFRLPAHAQDLPVGSCRSRGIRTTLIVNRLNRPKLQHFHPSPPSTANLQPRCCASTGPGSIGSKPLGPFGNFTTPDEVLIPPQRVRDAIQLVRHFDAWALRLPYPRRLIDCTSS